MNHKQKTFIRKHYQESQTRISELEEIIKNLKKDQKTDQKSIESLKTMQTESIDHVRGLVQQINYLKARIYDYVKTHPNAAKALI